MSEVTLYEPTAAGGELAKHLAAAQMTLVICDAASERRGNTLPLPSEGGET